MKPIRLTRHAREQAQERGATEDEVLDAIRHGLREPVRNQRILCRYNVAFNRLWSGTFYAVKQIAPVISEESTETVVITVYTFYF